MARRVVRISCEDHVTPVLHAIRDMHLTVPHDAALPALPADLVELESTQRGAMVVVKMRPTPAVLQWLVDVRKLSAQADAPADGGAL